jgi:ABC-type antimicrobial peptide transport system permease subunit
MFRNQILVAIRNLYRNSFYSFINIAGLTIGIACSILILLWVMDEVSYDRFHANYDRVHKAYLNHFYQEDTYTSENVPYPLREALKVTSADVEYTVVTNHGGGNLLLSGEKKLNKYGIAASEDFLKVFSFPVIAGDPNALSSPTSIILTESTAKGLFGDADPINQIVKVDNRDELRVAAIIRDVPSQSTLYFEYILPYLYYTSTQPWVRESVNDWKNNSFEIYVQLNSSDNVSKVNSAIEMLIADNTDDRKETRVFLHPMSKWRLWSDFDNGEVTGGMIEYVRLFTGIAVFILIIACINFMNLATARSEKRAREVGVRKSIGSSRKQLILQFLGESMMLALIGFVLALVIVEVAIQPYNLLVNKNLSIPYADPNLWLAAISLILLVGLIAGSYPAFYLSGFQPAKVLKGSALSTGQGATPRKVLVTLQFGFSIFLIIGTVVIYQQVMHVKSRHIGYDRENLLLIWTNSEVETSYPTIKEELLRTGVVKSVTKSSAPVTRIFTSADVDWPGKDPASKVGFVTVATEYDYTKTMGIRMLSGRDFQPEFPSDTLGVLINQAAVDLIGTNDPIGSKLTMWDDERTVIGVMENVVMGVPWVPVDPLAVVLIPEWSSTINVRLEETEDLQASVASVEAVFRKLTPSFPMWHRFADDEFEAKFSSIDLISRLASIFAALAIFITCMGLFGLAAFTAEQRRKELGIRKVLGATVSGLILLISRDFSRLIILSFIIVAPFAWYGLNDFLQQYPYRIDISWWVIPASGISALVLGMLIVGTQAMLAARSNPVEALRSE